MNSPFALAKLASQFRERTSRLPALQVVAGFDGFVDEMIAVVDERKSLKDWAPVKSIEAFGDWVKGAAGRSSLREIIVHRMDPGGCAVNLGDGLLSLGVGLDCFATLGQPIHSAFESFAQRCHSCHSWGRQPGRTLAFEFSDGKLMFSAVTQLADFDASLLQRALADGVYAQACGRAHLIALTDWTLYPHMTDCWQKLQAEVYQPLKHRPTFFVDLVDPTSRSVADIRAMLSVLPGFEKAGPTVLGLNGTEANVLARVLDMPPAADELPAVMNQAAALRAKLGISQVVTHCVRFAAVADRHGVYGGPGPYCAHPKKSTGAGDRFNAGYCTGLMLGFDPNASLYLGCASSGFFVRHARSAAASELAEFVGQWAEAKL